MDMGSARNMPQWPTLASAGVRHRATSRLDTAQGAKGAIVTLGENLSFQAGLRPIEPNCGLAFADCGLGQGVRAAPDNRRSVAQSAIRNPKSAIPQIRVPSTST